MPFHTSWVLVFGWLVVLGERSWGGTVDPAAVEEVLSGKRTVANAAWWGFDPEDSTEALQGAINSGARRVVVPRMPGDWVVRPIHLVSDQELEFQEGVVVSAKRGQFKNPGDALFQAKDKNNIKIRGYGATFRMQKLDYISGLVLTGSKKDRWFGAYEKAEGRATLRLRGCKNVEVSGLTLKDSGGDGITITGGALKTHCENVVIRDVVCDNHYRQGMSLIGAVNLLVENSVFSNTWGTRPACGLDIEPDMADEPLREVVFRNCAFLDNYGHGIQIFLRGLKPDPGDISIRFENCRVSSSNGAGIRISELSDQGPGGFIEFKNCVVENTVGYGIQVQSKSADRARVRFLGCELRHTNRNRDFYGAWAPIWFHLGSPSITKRMGGIDFEECLVVDDHDRPVILFEEQSSVLGLFDVTGEIRVRNPHGANLVLGAKGEGVTLKVVAEP